MTATLLNLVVRLFAPGEWGRAMRAELATIEDPAERRRYSLGCLRVVLRPAAWLRLGLVGAVAVLLFGVPGGNGAPIVAGALLVTCLVAVLHLERLPVVACFGALVWWAGLLGSATVRSHPQWALALIIACVAATAWRAGAVAALSTAFVTCLMIFAVAIGTYTALPSLAPNVVPANAVNPQRENQIESADAYVGELLLAAMCGLALIVVIRGSRVAAR